MSFRSRRSAAVGVFLVVLVAAGLAAVWTVRAVAQRSRELSVAVLSAAFRRDVAVGRVAGDPWRGLVLQDVSVRANQPWEDAVLTARRVTVFVDWRSLLRDVWRRRGVAGSIAQILIDEPALHVKRDAAGRWNITGLAPHPPRPPGEAPFVGRVVILGGTVTFEDQRRIFPRTFRAHLTDVSGSVEFARSPQVVFRGSLVEERDGRRVAGRVAGSYGLERGILDLDLEASAVDMGAWGPYLVNLPAFRLTGGSGDVALHILRTGGPGGPVTDVSGRVRVRDGTAVFPRRRVALSGVAGEVEIADRWLRTAGLRGRLNGVPLEVRGEASFYGEPHLDLVVRSSAADLATLGRLFFPSWGSRLKGVVRGEVRILGAANAPRVEGRVEASRLHFDRQPVQRASAAIALYANTVSLIDARGEAAGGYVSGSGIWTLGVPEFFLTLRFDGTQTSLLGRVAPEGLSALEGRMSGTMSARGGADGLTVAGQARLGGVRVQGLDLDGLEASFRYGGAGVVVEHALARRGGAWLAARGSVPRRGPLSLEVHAGTPEVAALPAAPLRHLASGPADVSARIGGTVEAPQVAGAVQMRGGLLGPLAFDTASGRFAWRGGTLDVQDARVRAGHARYQASGRIQLVPALRLALDIEADRAPVATIGRTFGLPVAITGTADGRVRLAGPAARPAASGSVSVREGEVLGQAIDEASAAFRWDGRVLVVEGGLLRRGQSVLSAAGRYDRLTGLDLDIAARGLRLRDLTVPSPVLARLGGTADVTGRITGPPTSATLSVGAASSDLTINGLRFDEASGSIRWQAGTLRLDPLALRLGEGRYEIAGEVGLRDSPRLSLHATVSEGRLSALLTLGGARLALPLEGVVSGTASLEGSLANPAARFDLRLSTGRFGDHVLAGGHADLTLRDGAVTIEALELRPPRGRVAATGRFDLRGESQIEVSGSELDLDFLRPVLGFRRPMVGRIDFTTQLGGTLASPEIGFDLEIARGGIEGSTFDSLVAGAFYKDGVLNLSQALLVQGGHRLRASGILPFNPALRRFDERGPLDLRLQLAEVNLGLLRLVNERVNEARGAVEGEVRVNGTASAPRLSGGIQIRDGHLRLRGLASPIETLNLQLRFEDQTIRLAEASARIGGGQARLDGETRLALGPPASLALVVPPEAPLVLQGSGVRMAVPPVLDARLDGTLRVWGTVGDPRRPPTVDGGVTLSDGTITMAPLAGHEPPALPLVFQGVRLQAGRDLSVRVGALRFGVKPEESLILTGTLRDPRLEGTVEAERGTMTALGNTFDLVEGTATFRPPMGLRPMVTGRAETTVRSTTIRLAVHGTAPDALTLDLRSDPDLPREEIVRLLGSQAGITGLMTGDINAALRAELSRRLLGPVTGAVARALGLSEFAIDYDFERPLGLRIGKRLLSNLYLTARSIAAYQGEAGRWLWSLEYRFARGWQLALQADTLGHRQAVVWYTTRF
ncbi:MAG: translocation/assembly module TamB domain-containing protein [Armatimonadota bacterium]|nr:translocation/assembly module TamB domain-containing protein [Armatimonadota bacterium]MDR7550157.1 translocation/assembly module TamB domain-containing protein [Armatimonadota bacterium]